MANTLAKPRTAKFDNAKAFLILCVVFGHGLNPYLSSPGVKWAHLWLYTFHMPAFIFLGGLFAKRTVNISPFNFKKVFSYFLLGMFIKSTIYLTGYFCGRNPKFNLFSENGVAWYIFVMAAHLLIAHVLRNFHRKKSPVHKHPACTSGGIRRPDRQHHGFLKDHRFLPRVLLRLHHRQR